MSTICCKGISTRPCKGCGKYICPAGGHAEMFTYTNRKGKWGEYCYSCYQDETQKERIEQLEQSAKIPYNILRDIEKQIDDKDIIKKIQEIFAHHGICSKTDYSNDENADY